MPNNVIPFPPGHSIAHHSRLPANKTDGRKADRKMRSRYTKIHPDDRRIIAKRLNDEIVQSRVKPGLLAQRAGLTNGTRELDKMRWREGNLQDKELLAYSNRYRDVMKVLASLSHQNFNLLVDRITVGTRLHSLRADHALSETEKTQRGLVAAANEADRSLGLFEQFRDTLRLKCEGLARGELDDWPNFPLCEDDIPRASGELDPHGDQNSEQAKWRTRLEGAYGYWGEEGNDIWSSGPDVAALGYLPHAYLGILADWNDWGVAEDLHYQRGARQELSKEYGRIPTAVYAEGRLPEVINTKECVHGSPLSVHDFMHTWLILYPNRSMSKIVPVLMTLDPSVGSVIEPITSRRLIELEQMELVGKHPKAYDGLVELLAPPPGNKSLAQHWIETGRWFRQNPLLQVASRAAELRARRDMLFTYGDSDEQN